MNADAKKKLTLTGLTAFVIAAGTAAQQFESLIQQREKAKHAQDEAERVAENHSSGMDFYAHAYSEAVVDLKMLRIQVLASTNLEQLKLELRKSNDR